MTRREKIASRLETVALVLDCILLSVFVVFAIGVLVKTLQMDLPWRRPRLRKNVRWLMMFTHEFTHLVFAILFFRKIHRFNVDNKDSHVSFSNGWFGYMPITLSPYCIPLFTLALLPWRFTADHDVYLYVIDVLIGLTYAFHVCCWARQIRLHQTDITGPGTFRSILFITFFLVVGLCLVILTPSSGVILALERVFWDFPRELVLMVVG